MPTLKYNPLSDSELSQTLAAYRQLNPLGLTDTDTKIWLAMPRAACLTYCRSFNYDIFAARIDRVRAKMMDLSYAQMMRRRILIAIMKREALDKMSVY